VKIATWNINGISSRLEHVLKWCQVARPDVLCLQETKVVDTKFPFIKLRKIGFDHIEVTGEKAYNGLAILSKYALGEVEKDLPGDKGDAPRRFLAVTIDGTRVVNVYVPHGTALGSEKYEFKLKWLARLRKYFDDRFTVDDRVLLCGDLNVAAHESDVWNPRQWNGKLHFTKAEREALINLKKWGFVDVLRQITDEPGEYTWWDTFRESSFLKNRGLRIDHIWASPPVAETCIDCWVDRTPRGWEKPSDHAPVIADFGI
jgi:exodeoxyribonuclease-3